MNKRCEKSSAQREQEEEALPKSAFATFLSREGLEGVRFSVRNSKEADAIVPNLKVVVHKAVEFSTKHLPENISNNFSFLFFSNNKDWAF